MKKYLIAALVVPLAAGTALAQGGPPAGQDRGRAMFERMCADADARLASRLAYVEAKVQPTQAQRGAWDTFARDSRAAAEPMKRLCENPPTQAAANDAAAALAGRERFVGAMAQSLAVLRPAVERLQATLDDAQKTKLAEALGRHGGRGRHH